MSAEDWELVHLQGCLLHGEHLEDVCPQCARNQRKRNFKWFLAVVFSLAIWAIAIYVSCKGTLN